MYLAGSHACLRDSGRAQDAGPATEGRYMRDYSGFDEVTLHEDGTVEFWDCFINGWVRTSRPSNKQLDTLSEADAEKIRRHLQEDYAHLFKAWLSR